MCDRCDVIGQDLREECIKLKMLVFDLERQNRALCELFQQKLPNQPAAPFQVAPPPPPPPLRPSWTPLNRCCPPPPLTPVLQVQTGPLPEFTAQLHNDSAKLTEPAQTDAQTKVLFTVLAHGGDPCADGAIRALT